MLTTDAQNPQLENIVATVIGSQPVELPPPPPPPDEQKKRFKAINCQQLDSGDYRLEWLIDRTLVKGQPCILAGEKKSLKTSCLVALAISLATGEPFLGHSVKGFMIDGLEVLRTARVGIMSGESGLATIQETARRVAKSVGRELAEIENIIWTDEVPASFEHIDDLEAIEAFIIDNRLEVLAIDPAYRCMSGKDAGNLFVQGHQLGNVASICAKHGCTLIICHHTRKRGSGKDRKSYTPPELDDIAWSGFSEFARQWLLLGRREEYQQDGEHKLWLSIGGSAGHSALYNLDVSEGVYHPEIPRKWDVKLEHGIEARDRREQAEADMRQKRLDEDTEKLRQTLLTVFPEGETKRKVRDYLHWGYVRFNSAFDSLRDRGELREDITIQREGQQDTLGIKCVI